jgi:hypothetical protein
MDTSEPNPFSPNCFICWDIPIWRPSERRAAAGAFAKANVAVGIPKKRTSVTDVGNGPIGSQNTTGVGQLNPEWLSGIASNKLRNY